MRVNAIALLKQAAGCIEQRRRDDGAYAFMLGELADHLGEVRDGKHTWAEFADFYCLIPRQSSTTPLVAAPATSAVEAGGVAERSES